MEPRGICAKLNRAAKASAWVGLLTWGRYRAGCTELVSSSGNHASKRSMSPQVSGHPSANLNCRGYPPASSRHVASVISQADSGPSAPLMSAKRDYPWLWHLSSSGLTDRRAATGMLLASPLRMKIVDEECGLGDDAGGWLLPG